MWYLSCLWIFVFFLRDGIFANSENTCRDLSPQSSIDIDAVMGSWNGVELINVIGNQQEDLQKLLCVRILIHDDEFQSPVKKKSPTGDQKKIEDDTKTREFKLLWIGSSENEGVRKEYSMKLNSSMPGFWNSSLPKNVSSTDFQEDYSAGKVQVVKAVGNLLILNFCYHQPNEQHFTIILSRSYDYHLNNYNNHEIIAAHNLLQRKGLDVTKVQKLCMPPQKNKVDNDTLKLK